MKSKLLLILALTLSAFTAQAQSLWGTTSVGMTVDQVKTAYPDAVAPAEPGTLKSGAKELLQKAGIEIGGRDFTAEFFFDPAGALQQVTLRPTKSPTRAEGMSIIDTLKEGLNAKYGAPNSSSGVPGGLGNIQQWTWLADKTNVTLAYIQIGGGEPTIRVAYQVRLAQTTKNL